ncbi:MAG TPA: glycosyltransferase family 4 protein [Candidatus Eremiobacteraceae bacterium]|nr:glycosyltransferase family 4 protein [Candidatus Eremiobacteraceae bacterium]
MHPRVLFVSSYPPRQCGIATFTEDVRDAYDALTGMTSTVIAMDEQGSARLYPEFVVGSIRRDDAASYAYAARLVNSSDADVVNIQHEYGLFGGERGEYLLEFIRAVHRPVVVTLHTTVPNPDDATLRVTRELCRLADVVIVLTNASRSILARDYGVDPTTVHVIMHGVPDVSPYHGQFFKQLHGLEDRTVISTFGLLSRGKGIESLVEALPAVIERHPEVTYVLWGETHPEVRRADGERYRDSLQARAAELSLGDRFRLVNRYMPDEDVVGALLATDLYVSPSLDPHQAVSGTLSYAVACGRAVIATEYQYAKELLGDGRGITVPFRDPQSLAAAMLAVLDDPGLRASLESSAYAFGRDMVWPKIATAYRGVFVDALSEQLGALSQAHSTSRR